MVSSKKSENLKELLSSVIESAPYGILALNKEGLVTVANSQVTELLNFDTNESELIDSDIVELVSRLHVNELTDTVGKSVQDLASDFDAEEIQLEERFLTFRGRKIPSGMLITIADVTSLKEEGFASLNSMLEGQEQERKRLAREIHDGVGPILSTLKMNLANIQLEISGGSEDVKKMFQQSNDMIDEAAGDLRAISHNLLPKVLSDFGLVEAFETLCERIDRTKSVNVRYIHSGFDERLDAVSELGLYRIGQELINNTLRHAKAKNVLLQLSKKEDYVQLLYEDDGSGFDVNSRMKGIGLMNIENRAKALFGEATIDSRPGKGMTAIIEVPLD